MSKKLNVAIIGCGRVAGHHARSIQKIEKLKLIAVCDLIKERADKIANDNKALSYQNYYTMLNEHPEIDIVAIITPSGMHYEHTMDIIENYKKHVVIEKPIVMRLSQGQSLLETATHNGVKVFPVFQYRFNKCVQRVKNAVMTDELGANVTSTVRTRWCRPQRYYDRDAWRGTFALDGGATTNQGIHHIDLLRYLSGEVKRVNSKMATLGVNVEVEDTTVATLEFQSGALGTIEITTAARPDDYESSISFVGSKGLAMIGGWATNELIKFSPNPDEEKLSSEVFPDVYGFGHKEIYLGAYNCLVNGGKAAVEFDDALNTIKLLHAFYRSDEIGNWVEVESGQESLRFGIPDDNLAKLYRTAKLTK